VHGRNFKVRANIVEGKSPSHKAPGASPAAQGQDISLLVKGMRNLVRPPAPSEVFGRGKVNDEDMRVLMRKLAVRIAREPDWPDKLAGAEENEDNPGIPAGYTYLLQLIAHDMVHTSTSLSLADAAGVQGVRDISFGFENCRTKALTLDTIFGGGPDVCPHAYEFSQLSREQRGVPRTRLRIGRIQRDGRVSDTPFADIGRGASVHAKDGGVREGERMLTEALIADPRNDDHALISQLTAVFHRLHNLIMDMIEDVPVTDTIRAYRNFFCARVISALIYRRVIVWDVMRRLLHPSVFRYYMLDKGERVAGGAGIPVEFAQGAFRCGHAMVRNSYRVNSEESRNASRAWQLSSQRSPGFLPVTDTWTVDWERFFQLDDTVPNHSRRLGPSFSPVVRSEIFFPPLRREADAAGLPNRDLVSAVYAQIWSVSPLIDAFRATPAIAAFLPAYSAIKDKLTDWLKATGSASGISEQLTSDDVATIAADPPLPFFILFEAACTDRSAAESFRGGGQHLGPLGSIIVAETILDALTRNDIHAGSDSDVLNPAVTLSSQIAAACSGLGIEADKLAGIPEIRTMPETLKFLRQHGALPN
jgi:hypothetical protein